MASDDILGSLFKGIAAGGRTYSRGLFARTMRDEDEDRQMRMWEEKGKIGDKEAQAKSDIASSLDIYYRFITPFVDGIDLPQARNDTITDLTVGLIVQDVLAANGATSDGVGFGLSVSTFLPSHLLGMGELGKSGGVSYV